MNDFFIKKACELATHSVQIGGGPFGCVIVDEDNNIIGQGYNCVTINNDPTQHAEIVAIRNACKKINTFKLDNCKLYTSCEPCPMCLSAIYWSHITEIHYGNTRNDAKNIGFDDEFIYDEINKNIDERKIKMILNKDESAKESFNLWKNKEDRINY
jgi:tRNA(Arg) A34 adenosine deaminase TadA